MADRTTPLILDALAQALAEPAGLPLHGGKATPGLFAATAPGRRAAQQCMAAGYLESVRSETRGKAALDICAITDRGVHYLLEQRSPRQVLEACLQAIDQRGFELVELVGLARRSLQSLEALKARVASALNGVQQPALSGPPHHATNGTHAAPKADWQDGALTYLRQWQTRGLNGDCPLPDLLAHLRQAAPTLTLGQFHDGLRTLHERGQIYLHPWTGPLHEIPDPSVALLMGHAVVFYASLRESEEPEGVRG